MSRVLLLVGVSLTLISLALSVPRLLGCIIVLENLNVLLLFSCLVSGYEEFRILFLALMVIFTVEVVLGLVILTRLWDVGGLIGLVGV
uniref:NADH dehydrogenase subunit 4L n=1 Tax=Dicrocoelium dendriticum TaxID=57078 RepID=A0A096XCC6_DICDE|nr:NADH dehydrogenase subunit 4L [Dicrocoelium dendriticum]AHG06510.1 NADH dehydrogenase subunit 4L [Dicrocoelium dendriticum]